MKELLSEDQLIERIFEHIDNKTTDMGSEVWREPSQNYLSQQRFDAEVALMKHSAIPFCPSASVSEKGGYLARTSAGTPILVVRGMDQKVRAFINSCRHRGMPVANGTGCARAFVCPYHAWSYSLDGGLKNIAGEHGFPGVNTKEHGLIEVGAREKGGIVYVKQEGKIDQAELSDFPDFFVPQQNCFEEDSIVDNTNWKLIAETIIIRTPKTRKG